ncbi:transposase [Mammaliicoccus sciuri]|uniref:transposase n=2 Tax=Mammaliicoccus sciuri TaxID=1296 RepID=UPI002DBFF23B|nr:transposase [Mammaliicoccus sciuri]MEB6226896.1 transposase [Mammaliicoccus sciuri]MEB7066449.1 transposase [Mammaliicoccus sciuri]
MARKKRIFSKEFKKEVVDLYKSGKSQKELTEEFNLNSSVLYRWIKEHSNTEQEATTNTSIRNDNLTDNIKITKEELEKELKNLILQRDKYKDIYESLNEKVQKTEITIDTLSNYIK